MNSNTVIDFIRVDSFLDDINRESCFDTNDMDGVSPNYRILLASDCSNDIDKCIDAEGTLITPYDSERDTGVNIIETLALLSWKSSDMSICVGVYVSF